MSLLIFSFTSQAQKLKGIIKDDTNGESIIGASVSIKGTNVGASTDVDGRFELDVANQTAPITVIIASIGYATQELVITDFAKELNVKVSSKKVDLKDVTITGSRVSEKQKEAPLTVESKYSGFLYC